MFLNLTMKILDVKGFATFWKEETINKVQLTAD